VFTKGKKFVAMSIVMFGICVVSALSQAAYADDSIGKQMTPLERESSSPRGTLKNPYTDKPDKIVEGHELFMNYGCNGCHGGTGGGGMCPPLNSEVWFYGSEDDTLFRLITLGSDALQKEGFIKKSSSIGPMPAMGPGIKSDDDLWKILAWIRSIYKGDPKRRDW